MTTRHLLRCLLLIVAVVNSSAYFCGGGSTHRPMRTSDVPTGPGTVAEARKYLEGSWSLVSMELFPPGEAAIHAAATGTLVYDAFANMTVELHFKPEAMGLANRIGIPAENGVLSTTGQTVVDMGNHSLSYLFEGQTPLRASTHPLDTNRPRYWEVNGNMLTLRTKDEKGSVLSVTVWRKEQ